MLSPCPALAEQEFIGDFIASSTKLIEELSGELDRLILTKNATAGALLSERTRVGGHYA
jgi:hypothetical protein